MLRLYMLGSGSRGNCLAIEAEGTMLLVDAGFSAKEIHRRAEGSGLDLRGLAGVVLTHEHGDHCAGIAQLLKQRPVPVLASKGTRDRVTLPEGTVHHGLGLMAAVSLGPFRVEACPVSHDAAEPVAIAVEAAGVRVAVAYDLGRPTAGVRYLLRGAHALVIEANHDDVLLRTSGYPPVVQQRIAGSGGHLSNRAAAELARELMHEGLSHVVLAHLSERCNTPEHARATVEPVLQRAGFRGRLHVALQGEPLAPMDVHAGIQLGFAELR